MKPIFQPGGAACRAVLLPICAFVLCAWPSPAHPSPSLEQLIIFTQEGDSQVSRHFSQTILPQIRDLSEAMNLSLSVTSTAKGAPPDVGITPLIVYQNHLGRSVYQGRTTTLDRVRHFIRTSRRIPQGKAPLVLTRTPAWRVGHAAVWAPIKISDLGGTQPGGYDAKTFQEETLQAILSGFSSFTMEEKAQLKRSDRGFYMDFYPWLSADGTLYISLALYSQFHCKKPVFETGDDKVIGPYKKRKALFEKAARLMEEKVKEVMADPLGGDGFDPVPTQTPVLSWKELGHDLPPAPAQKADSPPPDISLKPSWHLAEKNDDGSPQIQFRFPPPLDQYSGEFSRLTGTLDFPGDLSFSGMKGAVYVHVESVTMGEADLDNTLKGSLFLDMKSFPTSHFTLEKTRAAGDVLEFGRLFLVTLSGSFQLKDKTVPLSLPVEMEAVLDSRERPRILIRGTFTINLKDYGIEGATGPAPQKHTLLIDLNLAMIPAQTG